MSGWTVLRAMVTSNNAPMSPPAAAIPHIACCIRVLSRDTRSRILSISCSLSRRNSLQASSRASLRRSALYLPGAVAGPRPRGGVELSGFAFLLL